MGKIKQEAGTETVVKVEPEDGAPESLSYADKLRVCTSIAHPMANKKLAKKCYKLIKKASEHKKYINCGLKLVQKHIRLGHKGIVLFAGDISPIEIMCHLPGVCEEKSIPYCYVPSRQDIGTAMGVKRGCLMVLVKEHEDYGELFEECKTEIKTLPSPL
ncbi:NHP2 ribonucleoprotein [Arctopsyche grandis]|uniref:NHP2 ribonucleoprotein n=1 Tax=Arctopsyche grandis TaxID=121162 RepID=UPI00406D6F0A